MVVDRKSIFILTAGDPQQQLNKIKHTEWHGLEKFLKVYFADEVKPKPSAEALFLLMEENNLEAADLLMIGNDPSDEILASTAGIDYLAVSNFIQQ
jgi:FMN phosphatase YigB (HAD superfamily)